jgi:hypothetical protein
MLLCTKIKLQVSEAAAAALEFMQGKCHGLNILQRFLARLGPHTSSHEACGALLGSAAINTL